MNPVEETGVAVRGAGAFAAMAGLVIGTLLQLQQPTLWSAVVYAGLVGLGLAGFIGMTRVRRRGLALQVVMLMLGIGLGAGLAGWRGAVYLQDALSPVVEGRDVQVVGVVSQMPQRNDMGVRFRLDVESARWADRRSKTPTIGSPLVPPHLALGWYAANTGLWDRSAREGADTVPATAPGPLHAGERWRMTVRLKAPHGNLNPHGFDYELWLWEQGVQATGYVRTGAQDAPPERLGTTWAHPLEQARESVRDAVFSRIVDRKRAGVIAALVTGDQNAIDRADWDVFRATGVAHLMSISGLHITMFAWFAGLLVGAVWRRSAGLVLWWPAPHAALVGGVALATLYAVFSGWGVPSQRTICMLAAVAGLRLTGRRWPWPHVWLLACTVVVVMDPWALMQAGFWLSFVAVGVLFATDSGAATSSGTDAASRFAQNFREQWVVTLALTPLSVLLFQQVSVVGLVANAVAIPWVTLVVTPLAMAGVAIAPLWQGAAWAVQGLAIFLQWLASFSFATVSMAAPPLWMAVCGVAGGMLVAMRLPWSLRTLGLPMLLPVLLWQPPRPHGSDFDVLAVDIGQGNAVLVRTANHSLLYDTGPRYSLESDAGHRVLVPLLRALDERLDTVVLSHRDSDHTGGAPAVLETQPQAMLLSSIEATHPLQALRPAERCVAGQRWRWDSVDFEVLHPTPADYERPGVKPNALSCVLRIGNGRATALLAGDIERDQEAALLRRNPDLSVDMLLAPHHGSKTSSSDALLSTVRPRLVLVQSGYRNRYGHPAAEVVARYRAHGAAVLDSPRCGAMRWHSAAPADAACQRAAAPRYWHHREP